MRWQQLQTRRAAPWTTPTNSHTSGRGLNASIASCARSIDSDTTLSRVHRKVSIARLKFECEGTTRCVIARLTIPVVGPIEARASALMGNQFLDAAIEIALEAGNILLSEFDQPAKISYKGEADLVTQADRRSEQAIVSRLRDYFPQHAIVAEEGGGQETGSRCRWFVDPLDGTTNFAHGYPCFAVSMGLEEDRDLRVGVIYQPVTRELLTAAKGQGAFLNQKRIQVSSIDRLATSLLATGFPSVQRA